MKTELRKVTIEQEVYIAEDGKEFDDEDDCLSYEAARLGERINMWKYSLIKTHNAGCCRYAKLDTPDQVTDFITLCKRECVSVEGIVDPGIYIYTEGTYGDRETAWINMTRAITIINGGNNR